MDYWYRYRQDLWKRVTIFDFEKSQIYHDKRPENLEKLPNNIRRAQRQIEAYALCNDWEMFGTFTLSPKYRDRADLDGFRKDFMQFIRDVRKKSERPIAALLVPELHKDRDGWHIHGLFNQVPMDELRAFTLRERLPVYLRQKIKAGDKIYDWPAYRKSFGWVDMEPLRNRDAAARYITKYISKGWDSTTSAIEKGKHLYYVTRGLALPELVETAETASGRHPEAVPSGLIPAKSFAFDYGEVQWYELPRSATGHNSSCSDHDTTLDEGLSRWRGTVPPQAKAGGTPPAIPSVAECSDFERLLGCAAFDALAAFD